MSIKREHYHQLSKFIFVGTINTALGYGLFSLFIYLNIFYLVSLTLSHIIASFNSFLWNRYFTFKSKNNIKSEVRPFLIIYGIIYVVNYSLLFIAVQLLHQNPIISQLFVLALVTIISFIGQRNLTFKKNVVSS